MKSIQVIDFTCSLPLVLLLDCPNSTQELQTDGLLIGTGTPTGDPMEAKAIGKVFGKERSPGEPLFLSVSTGRSVSRIELCL